MQWHILQHIPHDVNTTRVRPDQCERMQLDELLRLVVEVRPDRTDRFWRGSECSNELLLLLNAVCRCRKEPIYPILLVLIQTQAGMCTHPLPFRTSAARSTYSGTYLSVLRSTWPTST